MSTEKKVKKTTVKRKINILPAPKPASVPEPAPKPASVPEPAPVPELVPELVHVSEPEYLAKSPEYVAKSPEYLAKSPEYVAKSPEYVANTPEHLLKTPEYDAEEEPLIAPPPAEASNNPNASLFALLDLYLSNVTKDSPTEQLELEVKFGTLGAKPITRINYDNIIKKLLAVGFTIDQNVTLLRIQNEYMDVKTGTTHLSNIRTEIDGLQNVRKYCQTNNIIDIENGVSFLQKSRVGDKFNSIDKPDFNFRMSLNKEITLKKKMPMIRSLIDKWNDQKKTFRYLNRIKMIHPLLPVVIDMSIVKESKKNGRFYVPEYNIHDAEVFNSAEHYEVEIECVNRNVGIGSNFVNGRSLWQGLLKQCIKYVLAGIQETNYPISYPEQQMVLQLYMVLLWGKDYHDNMRVSGMNFVGPSSYTLEMKNIRPLNGDSNVPNIRENFAVTDKADGERKLLFIAPDGKIYLINTNMNVQFTGTITQTKEIWNTLLDGEHILYDKHKNFINMYAAFDMYYRAGEDIRAKAFVPVESGTQEDENINYNNFRLPLLEETVFKVRAMSVVRSTDPAPLKITQKRFYAANRIQSIFQNCQYILTKEYDNLFEYETDGLIFTATNRGVGSAKVGEYLKPIKTTWDYSFKWKPAHFNTIDFLVTLKKNANGTDFIGNTLQLGTDISAATQIPEYKTAILRVGFNESKHGFINPYQDMIDDKIPAHDNFNEMNTKKDKYVPMQFFPTEPSDYKAGLCNLRLHNTDKYIYSEAGEIIEDNMIVEFSYDMTKEEQWRWVPLRVRYDKTAQLRAGEPNFGNAFHVANSNWHSIHNPITQQMIMTGENIPAELNDDDVYYNKVSGVSFTRALRDFHNLYVKQMLIKSVTKPGHTLIDLAVGKGGDFPKWIDAKLKFVFGIDIARDNIQNRFDGACARYLNYRKSFKVMPAALFVNGNSSVNIKNTTGILVDKDKQITRAVFGQGPKDAKILGQGVYKQYGVASEGFDVTSIQFAIHYMFENQETLQNFLQNVSEVTKDGGYFICTSYDGDKIFNLLKNVEENDSSVIFADAEKKKRIWEVTKRYDRAEFNDDDSCVGYAIDVYQETINKTFREYLVNYNYLTRLMENYGFVPATTKELQELKAPLTTSSGLFGEVFNKMLEEVKKNPRAKASYNEAPNMTDGERTISFLNRYFIYKKVRKISDVEKVSLNLQKEGEAVAVAEAADTLPKATTTTTTAAATAAALPTVNKIRVKKPKTLATPAAALATPAAALATPAAAAEGEEKIPVKKLKRVLKITNK